MKPARIAAAITAVYFILSAAYILASDYVALRVAENARELEHIQSLKGLGYVVIASAGLFLFSWLLLRRLREKVDELQEGREKMLLTDRRLLAGTLSASIAHDMNNLLGAVRANLEFIEDQAQLDPKTVEALEDTIELVDGFRPLNDRLGQAYQGERDEAPVSTDPGVLVRQATHMIASHSRVRGHHVSLDLEDVGPILVSPGLLQNAVINLVLNAADASPSGTTIRVRLRSDDAGVRLSVEDQGPGIPADERDQILEPFHTTKPGGTGLGLFTVAYCARAHGGRVEIHDGDHGGASFEMVLAAGGGGDVENTPGLSDLARRE